MKRVLGILAIIAIVATAWTWAQIGPQPLSVTDIVPATNVTSAHQWVVTANQAAQRVTVNWWEGYTLPDGTFVQVRRKSCVFENHPDILDEKGEVLEAGAKDWDLLMTGATIGGQKIQLGDTLKLLVWALKQKGEL